MPARVYVEQLATQSTRILALNQPPDYPMPVVATWNLSFDRLKQRSPGRGAAAPAVRLLLGRARSPWTCSTATR